MEFIETLTTCPPPLTSDLRGGWRVGKTRVSLDTVIGAHNIGASPESIVDSYDTLELADVYAVITYYLWNRAVVDAYLDRRQTEVAGLRNQIQARFPSDGIRERLLERRTTMQ